MRSLLQTLLVLLCLALALVAGGGYENQDPYRTLGVSRRASEKEIKAAYRKKALEWHPDRNADRSEAASEMMGKLNAAYETLSDATKRREYDQFGSAGAQHGGGGGFGRRAHTQQYHYQQRYQPPSKIESATTQLSWHNYERLVLQGDGETPWLIQLYVDRYAMCRQFSRVWESLYGELDGIVHMGRIQAEREHALLQRHFGRFSIYVPMILLVMPDGTVHQMDGALGKESVTDFVSRHYHRSAVDVVDSLGELDAWHAEYAHMPRLVLVSHNVAKPSLLARHVAFVHRHHVRVAVVSKLAKDILHRMNVVRTPAVVLFHEKTSGPKHLDGRIARKSIHAFVRKHYLQRFPQLTYHDFASICPNGIDRACVILVADVDAVKVASGWRAPDEHGSKNAAIQTALARRFAYISAKGFRGTWINAERQAAFLAQFADDDAGDVFLTPRVLYLNRFRRTYAWMPPLASDDVDPAAEAKRLEQWLSMVVRDKTMHRRLRGVERVPEFDEPIVGPSVIDQLYDAAEQAFGLVRASPYLFIYAFFLLIWLCSGSGGRRPNEDAPRPIPVDDENAPAGRHVGFQELSPAIARYARDSRKICVVLVLRPENRQALEHMFDIFSRVSRRFMRDPVAFYWMRAAPEAAETTGALAEMLNIDLTGRYRGGTILLAALPHRSRFSAFRKPDDVTSNDKSAMVASLADWIDKLLGGLGSWSSTGDVRHDDVEVEHKAEEQETSDAAANSGSDDDDLVHVHHDDVPSAAES